jgi:hypothetical protein
MVFHRTAIVVGTAVLWLSAAGCEDRGGGDRRAAGQPGPTGKAGEQATASAGSATGQVVSAKKDQVVVKQQGKDQELKLKVDPSTQVLIDGKQSSADQLREGTQVRVSYDGSQKATRIEVTGGAASAGGDPANRPGGSAGTTGGLGGSSSSTPGQTGGPGGNTATPPADPGAPRGSGGAQPAK